LENVLLGGIVARLLHLPATIGAVTGLGTLFAEERFSYRIVRRMVVAGIRWGFKNRRAVLAFENRDDRDYFVVHKAVEQSNTAIIPGAGVARDELNVSTKQQDKPVVFFASRMIRSKGMLNLVRAAEEVHKSGIDFELWLAGDIDTNNPTSLTTDEIEAFGKSAFIRYLGHRSDMASLMRDADIFCLPTYYREGLPRVIIEACAAGKPVITTDMPGCRDIVQNNVNGLLVAPRDHQALVESLKLLLSDPALRSAMGKESRRIFEERYTLDSFFKAFNHCYEVLNVPLRLK
jgi:glycosyltransferase involved in cell wall biosynthesis